MEYQPWIIQSGRWCAQSLFENFTLQRLAALIRAELRWTTAPCQWIYSFHGGESTWYGANIGSARRPRRASCTPRSKRDKLRSERSVNWATATVRNVTPMCSLKYNDSRQEIKQNGLTMFRLQKYFAKIPFGREREPRMSADGATTATTHGRISTLLPRHGNTSPEAGSWV